MGLDLATARAIIAEASRLAAERAYKPVTIVVLDAGGYLVAAERADGSPNKQFEIAHGKAHGAVSVGMGTRGLTEYSRQEPVFFNGLAHALGSPLLAAPGGVLVLGVDGAIIGAVGVSGESGDNDELLAVEAITSVSLVPKVD